MPIVSFFTIVRDEFRRAERCIRSELILDRVLLRLQ